MDILFNILILGFIALITYWWATQGLFSATLHLVCVIGAGVLAFATWEPASDIVMGAAPLVPYARGIGLLLPFAVYLLVLRIAADKLAPDNLNFPHVVNLALGGAVGAAAGTLTVGISLIGIGFTHSSRDMLGIVGTARNARSQGQPNTEILAFWVPAHVYTGDFFALLSAGSFTPTLGSANLSNHYWSLGKEAFGLNRDTYNRNGKLGRTVSTPGAVRIDRAEFVPGMRLTDGTSVGDAYVLDIHFDPGASDGGQGFAISASQLRLLGSPGGKSSRRAEVSFPIAWAQEVTDGVRGTFRFDDLGHYISAPPGSQSLDATVVFPATKFPANAPPKYLWAMGHRIAFPQIAKQATAQDGVAMLTKNSSGALVEVPPGTPSIAPEDMVMNDQISPASADLNNLGNMKVKDTNYLFEGEGEYTQGGFRGSKGIIVKGIWSPPSTRIVRLNVSRGSKNSIDLWNDRSKVRERAGEDSNLALVDNFGKRYYPIGYIHLIGTGDRGVNIRLQRDGAYFKISSFPTLSSSGSDTLYALFSPPVNSTIVGVVLGNEWVAKANLEIQAVK
jgi:hypothetical protein